MLGCLLAVGTVAGVSSASRNSSKLAITPAPAYSADQLSAYAGTNWLSPNGDLANDRYSSLTQITPANVGKLQLAWTQQFMLGANNAGIYSFSGGNTAGQPYCAANVQTTACPGQEANAIVADGVMYISDSTSNVYAYDATNGTLLWQYNPVWPTGFNIGSGGRQAGVTVGQGNVYVGLRDGVVVALNQQNGQPIWSQTVAPWQQGVRLSETPLYYNGEVIEGTSGGDGGSTSAQMMAFNATTGELLWSWSIIPAHNQPGGNSWPWSGTGSNFGGGAMWQNPAVDAKNGLVIFGTGNPVPWNSRGPGSDLWDNSIVALDANTGVFKWAYQTVHHDLWDSDLPNEAILFDMKVGGKTVPAVGSVAKFGWTWVLNRLTGKPLEPVTITKVPGNTAPDVNPWPVQPIPQTPNTLSGCIAGDPTSGNGANECYDQPLTNVSQLGTSTSTTMGKFSLPGGGRLCTNSLRWAGLNAPDGHPYDISCHFTPYDTSQYVTAPFESMDWPESSYSPLTQSFITCGVTNRTYGKEQVPAASQVVGSAGGIGSGILSVADSSIDPLNLNDFGNFSALNMNTVSPTSGGKWAWHQIWPAPCYSGTTDTASGLTFVGHLGQGNAQNGQGYLAAVNTKTGQELWESPLMNAPAGAPPMTYSVNGTQYVSILVGGESHNDPTRPNPAIPNERVRGATIYTYVLGA
ncbi:MAG: PQQ-binding-like beta-propeller repeat protein [Actinobacteria bacterium]|nr:PQQ-binding-like beta-propeller repeat protein [Actinomycetota bacterium]